MVQGRYTLYIYIFCSYEGGSVIIDDTAIGLCQRRHLTSLRIIL